jgi:hypothetical protein
MYNFIAIKGRGGNTLAVTYWKLLVAEKWLRMQAKVERLYYLSYFLMQGWEKKSLDIWMWVERGAYCQE